MLLSADKHAVDIKFIVTSIHISTVDIKKITVERQKKKIWRETGRYIFKNWKEVHNSPCYPKYVTSIMQSPCNYNRIHQYYR